MVQALTYTFTTRAEILRIYGQTGATLQTADLKQTNIDGYWEELVADVTETMNQYLWQFYDEVDLADSHWVRRRASYIGCHYLSQRRGNAGLFNLRYQEILAELLMVKDGYLQIPNLATRSNFVPGMANIRIDDWYHTDKIRVHENISVGGSHGTQSTSYQWPLQDWY